MKYMARFACTAALLLMQDALAQDSLAFSAVLRVDDGLSHVIQSDVALGTSRIVAIDERYSIEFVAPAAITEEARAAIRLLERSGDEYAVLHASQQSLVEQMTRHVGYRLCAGKLTFESPSPDFPPDCDG